jgi:hypothetical protein
MIRGVVVPLVHMGCVGFTVDAKYRWFLSGSRPYLDQGEWRMTVDGVEIVRTDMSSGWSS